MNGIHFFSQPSMQSQIECERHFRDVLDAITPGWIAGGCLRDYFSHTPNTTDVDVWFESEQDLAAGIESIEATGAEKLYERCSIQGYTFHGRHVQLVKRRFFPSMEDCIAEFDFTVCSAAMDYTGRVICHRNFFEDLAFKRLAINSVSNPAGSLQRVIRYVTKGFNPDPSVMCRLAEAVRELDLTDPMQNSLRFYSSGKPRSGRFEDDLEPAWATRQLAEAIRELDHVSAV